MTFDLKRFPKGLLKEYEDGRCVVFVGAGASQAAGYPGWDDFLNQLIDRAVDENVIQDSEKEDFRKLIGVSGNQLTLASALKDRLGRSWDQVISELFYDDPLDPAEVHERLADLDRTPMVITTNYDTLIENTYTRREGRAPKTLTFSDAGEIRRLMMRKKFFILKAHGDAARPGNGMVLTTSDYRHLIHQERAYQTLLASIFTVYTVLFVGVSLDDPEVRVILDYLADAFDQTSGPVHYALMPTNEVNKVALDRWQKDYQVKIIPISPDSGFQEVPEALEALANSTKG